MAMARLSVVLALVGQAMFVLCDAVTPVQKVIELLEKLEAKIEQEGKDEAAAYDKYACFCKEQVDDKQYQIEKSDALIAKLSAEIDKLGSEITALDGEIGALATKISSLKNESATAQGIRDGEHAQYLVAAADAAGAVDACERAIAALKESKGGLGGKSELEAAALVQVRSVARAALAMKVADSSMSAEQMRTLNALSQPGKAYEYTYHSNDIIALIENLRQRFKLIKEGLDQREFDLNALHDKKQLSLTNEIKFAEKEKAEKEALAAEKTETKEAKEADKGQETTDRNSDKSFQNVLVDECQQKALLWDQRSSTRAQELTAMSQAMEALKSGVAPNFQANKKLVGLQTSKRVAQPSGHWEYVEDKAPAAASFLQEVRAHTSLRGGAAGRAADNAGELLDAAGMRLRSPVLTAMALKVRVSEDHFVKVRGLIKDLVAKLEQQARDEQDDKSFCDREMSMAVAQRDAASNAIEDNKAKISKKESEKQQLMEEVAELQKAIAENAKALQEATMLREKEHMENEKTVADAGAGKVAVEQALQVLKTFYEGAAFAQYIPPNSDREGLTVSDRAPEVFDSEYKGSQDASKGIIGMLEVILSDFDRTVGTVTGEESDAQGAFDEFKGTNERDTETKEGLVTEKEGLISDAEDALVTLQGLLKEAEEKHKDSKDEFAKLHSMCVQGEETYEERVAKRKQEIEALKEAHDILENWQQ